MLPQQSKSDLAMTESKWLAKVLGRGPQLRTKLTKEDILLFCNQSALWSDPEAMSRFALTQGILLFKKQASALIKRVMEDSQAYVECGFW